MRVMLLDASWTFGGAGGVWPKWSRMRHSRYLANCKVVIPANDSDVYFEATRDIGHGEELLFDYGQIVSPPVANARREPVAPIMSSGSAPMRQAPTSRSRPRGSRGGSRQAASNFSNGSARLGGRMAHLVMVLGMLMLQTVTARATPPSGASFLRQEVIENAPFVPVWARDLPMAPNRSLPHGAVPKAEADGFRKTTDFAAPWLPMAPNRSSTSGTVARKASASQFRRTTDFTTPPSIAPSDDPVAVKDASGQPKYVPTWARPTVRRRLPQLRRVGERATPAAPARQPDRMMHYAVHPYKSPAYGASRLRTDQVEHAKQLARRLANDTTPGRITAPIARLEEMALAVTEARVDGINPRTASKDAFALREFEAFAEISGFGPNLRTEWTKRFPERESIKLASWLMWRAQRAIPRSRKGAAKPMSIYNNYLALRRVFRQRDVELPIPGVVRETLKGLIRRYIRCYGIEALRPKRVEPVTPAIVRKVLDLAHANTAVIQGISWSLECHSCFIVTAWMVINLSVGSRKGESTRLLVTSILTTGSHVHLSRRRSMERYTSIRPWPSF
ncbi:SET domain-containing protein-lysine N-methyltransferase [bacterium]|nr:SET domain-containing protein-lysine N-methyltransferase [bacterium]